MILKISHRLILILVVSFCSCHFVRADQWPMKQRDIYNTGRAEYWVPQDRQNDTFFADILWQTTSTGAFDGGGVIFYDGAGPAGADVAVCTNTWPNRATAVDRHSGKKVWQESPGGGDTIGRITPAFSNDGSVVYAVNDALSNPSRTFLAWHTITGPSGGIWDNRDDANPTDLGIMSPTVAPDHRIFLHRWNDTAYAGTDSGAALSRTWASMPSGSMGAGHSDPVLYPDEPNLYVIQCGRSGRISCFDGTSGVERWTRLTYEATDASVTIDPENGNCYVNAGFVGDIYVVGLDKEGANLWTDIKLKVYDYIDGVNDPERAQATGCLSHDGSTYYFQTIGAEANGKLYAVNTSDGSLKWAYETQSLSKDSGDTFACSPIVTRNSVIVVGNNYSGDYLAIRDDGDQGTLLDSISVEPNPFEPYYTRACAVAALASDGKLYIPYRTYWTVSNGDEDVPSGNVEFCITAFDLSGCDPVPGDTNNDCQVNLLDFAYLVSHWLECGLKPPSNCSP